jgi:putative oxygen-independent coproporphyrinogen III oxidase
VARKTVVVARSHPPTFGVYVHVPFCTSRCGYCDFNTYVPSGGGDSADFVAAALLELRLARERVGARPLSSVFFGGGTPTLLGADALRRLLAAIEESFGLVPGAEITTEANPESTGPSLLRALRAAGFTRVSVGMQSASAHVLAALDRVHTPGRAVEAVQEAREAGFPHVSLDLIYGAAEESDADWEQTLDAAVRSGVDHVSAYALTVERGTGLAAAIRRGTARAPDEDTQARRFRRADARLRTAGFAWYELSSWATEEAARCRHNLGYWRSQDWWGIGPGAHSHLGAERWWNVRHPAAYAQRLAAGHSPVAGGELLSLEQRALEEVMLGLRLSEGLPLQRLSPAGAHAAQEQAARGLLTLSGGRIRLSCEGRLLADTVIRALSV